MTYTDPISSIYGLTPINFDMTVLELYKLRILNQLYYVDSYKGTRILKFPEDLRMYERLIDETKPEVIIELGVQTGGSSLWFADRLSSLCGGGEVIGVEISPHQIEQQVFEDPRITIISGNLADQIIIDTVHSLVGGRRAMVIEDAAHTYDCTLASMQNYWDLVPVGGWFIVEDGIVDVEPLRAHQDDPRGVIPSIEYFLTTDEGSKFSKHRLEPYGITSNPGGWLRRDFQ
jgi:cephalosporin hydroxylase